MAKSSRSVESLIKSTFALQVAVRSTEEVDSMCRKNHLKFCEILKPFCALSNNVQLKDVQGHLYNLRNVRVQFSEPPLEAIPESKLRIQLGEVVQAVTSHEQVDGRPGGSVHIGNVTTTATTPWFEAYRDTYLDFLKQSEHETIKHYISVILVVPSTSQDPIEEFTQLYAKQKQSEQSKHPKWLTPHIFYYHVLLHDAVDGAAHVKRAQENYDLVKAKFGETHTCTLVINSSSSSPSSQHRAGPDIWSHLFRAPNGTLGGEDETDGVFKKFWKKNKKVTSPPNNAQQDTNLNLSNVGVVKPNLIREEPQLISLEQSSSDTSTVEPGADPLSQMVSNSPLPMGEGLGDDALMNLLDHSYHNSEDMVNSGEGSKVQYGQCLSESDHRNLRSFVIDLVSKRLLPHLNEVLKNLNEWLVSRRSVRRSFSNMFRGFPKMFGGPNNVMSDDATYATTSLEMQIRQLADIAFLLQSYDLAFQSYHQVKKDFQGSNAWMYYAGSVEMCAVSAYLLSSTRRDVVSYLEEAISVYNLSCKAPYYAIRASLILMDILKERGLYKDLAQLCVRMTAEDADLRSAVCLEQAAHAFLRCQPSMPRKHALHMVLAGNRYARAAQRLHSLRSYQQSLKLYEGKGWTLAEDYVQFCLAKHSFNLHRLQAAKEAFERLLSHESIQSPSLQRLHLQDYIYVHKQLLLLEGSPSSTGIQVPLTTPTTSQSCASSVCCVPILPLPFLHPQLTRVTFITAPSSDHLQRPLELEKDPTRPRSSSHRGINQLRAVPVSSGIEELRVETMLSKSRSSSTSGVRTLSQHLQHLGGESARGSCVIGVHDYQPTEGSEAMSVGDWEELEMKAAMGTRGTLHENFRQSILVMDSNSDNTTMPFAVVNESVAVGVVLKNPLKGVPLLMTNLCLVWEAEPSSSPTPSSPSPSSAAVCEVLKRVQLQPEEEKMVTLRITPLKEGELVVSGFIFNLCMESNLTSKSSSPLNSGKANSLTLGLNSRDTLYQIQQGSGYQSLLCEGVQGRVEFGVRGHRLNDSKTEKAVVMYSKDYRLHWKVTAPMPKIVATLSALPQSLLTGETTRLSLEVFNVGQVSLNSLRLTSSLGPQLLMDKVSSELHHPIYPSTLLSPLHHTPPPSSPLPAPPFLAGGFSPGCLELPLPEGRLDPGKGIQTHLMMQGALCSPVGGSGEIPWNIVLYYEPALISANSRLSHRVLRHSCMLHVRESLQLRASAIHSQLPTTPTHGTSERLDLNRLVVTVEAENRCQLINSSSPVEIRVSQLSCISSKWTLEKLDREQGLLCLLPSESGVVHLKGSRLEHSTAGGLVCGDVPLGPTLILSHSFPVKEMFAGSAAFSSLNGEGEGRGKRNSSRNKEEMVLMVFWQALVPMGSDTVFSYGHHTVIVPLPQSMSALRESSQPPSPYDLVKFYLEHPVSYQHRGFLKSDIMRSTAREGEDVSANLCQVPVTLVLQNCHHAAVKVMVELLQPREGDHEKHPEPGFFWSGGCKRQLEIEGRCTHSLSVFANFCWPAVYNLNTVRVLAAVCGGSGYHVQRWHRTSQMTVHCAE